MPRKAQRVIRIHRRQDGRFETRNEIATDSPLGVDSSPAMAMGAATREATILSRETGLPVLIEIQQPNGKWKREHVVHPPKRR